MKTVRAAWWIWAVVPLLVIAALLIAGCGTVDGFCVVQPIGQTEGGASAFAYHCEPKK